MRLKPTRQHYEKVVALRRQGLSIREIASKTGVAKSAVHRWLSIFAGENVTTTEMKSSQVTAKRVSGVQAPESCPHGIEKVGSDRQESLEDKVKRLEQELIQARLERDLYNEIINVAEQKFDIQIRKKAGTKR